MTRLVDELLSDCLRDTPGWQAAHAQFSPVQEDVAHYCDAPSRAL